MKDVNDLWRYGYRKDGTVDLEELYEAADWLVSAFENSDGRAYPPRAGDPLIVLAFEACGFGY